MKKTRGYVLGKQQFQSNNYYNQTRPVYYFSPVEIQRSKPGGVQQHEGVFEDEEDRFLCMAEDKTLESSLKGGGLEKRAKEFRVGLAEGGGQRVHLSLRDNEVVSLASEDSFPSVSYDLVLVVDCSSSIDKKKVKGI